MEEIAYTFTKYYRASYDLTEKDILKHLMKTNQISEEKAREQYEELKNNDSLDELFLDWFKKEDDLKILEFRDYEIS